MKWPSLEKSNFPLKFPLLLTLSIGILFYVRGTTGSPDGAPLTDEICRDMVPKHGKDPQGTMSPYAIYVDRGMVRIGEYVRILISAPRRDHMIKGFLLQARRLDFRMTTMPWGKFALDDKFAGAKLGKCGNGTDEGNIITHVDNSEKEEVRVQWMAPNMPGTYVILATIVKNGATYWVRMPSWNIVVHP